MGGRRKLAVFDLDGTLFPGSTLRRYFGFGAKRLFCKGRLISACKIIINSALGKAGLISHIRMKVANTRILEDLLTIEEHAKFAKAISGEVNPKVTELLEKLRNEGYLLALASASPEMYCRLVAAILGMNYCFATEPISKQQSDYKECRGEEKLRRVESAEGELAVVVTDHHDDLPLLMRNSHGINYIVRHKKTDLDKIRSFCPNIEILE